MGLVNFGLWLVILVIFTALSVFDIRWFLLPDRLTYSLSILVAGEVIVNATVFHGGWPTIMTALWGVLCIAGLFYGLFAVSRGRWIGFGDVKLAVALGLLVGGPLHALAVVFIASLLGSVVAIPMLVGGRAKATTHLPFGPLLLIAAAIVVFASGQLGTWYTLLYHP